jgi:biotin carboxyl carrier protein
MGANRIILRDERGMNHEVTVTGASSVTLGDRAVTVRPIGPGELRVADCTVWIASQDDRRWVFVNGQTYLFELQRPGEHARRRVGHDENLSAPMPATVVKLHVAPGDEVKAGQLLVVLEAMKMELPIRAASDARVESIRCTEGELVQPGQPLLELTPHTQAASSAGQK